MISNILQILDLQSRTSNIFAWSLEDLFLTVGQNNFGKKIPRLLLPTILFIAPKRPSSLGNVSTYETDIKRISRNRVQIFSCFLPLSLSTFMLDNKIVKNRCNYLKKIVFYQENGSGVFFLKSLRTNIWTIFLIKYFFFR